uniref:PUM-HD domain-containing protein n=1 Tax=Globodera pallida TaxID=36090 RepID=A0A183C863_GLOPA
MRWFCCKQLQFVVDAITNSPSDSIAYLSLHEYGHWVIRRVLDNCTEQQKRPTAHMIEHGLTEDRKRIVRSLHENVLTLHGLPEDRKRIVRSLHENVLTLVTDQYGNYYGNYVIQHVRRRQMRRQFGISPNHLHKRTAFGNYRFVCRFCRRIVSMRYTTYLLTLVTDKYGNYVIQHVIEHGLPENRERIYGNYVIRLHMLEHGLPENRERIYGNYVIQHVRRRQMRRQFGISPNHLHKRTAFGNYRFVCRFCRRIVSMRYYGNYVIQHVRRRQMRRQFGISPNHLHKRTAFGNYRFVCLFCRRIVSMRYDGAPWRQAHSMATTMDCPRTGSAYGNYVIQHVIEHGLPHSMATT